ncbi:hypothetical protein GCM10027037_03370 [Mucilaginibacter koreensis]
MQLFYQFSERELESLLNRTIQTALKEYKASTNQQEQVQAKAPATRQEAAAYLKISTRGLDDLLKYKVLPSFKIGRSVRISYQAIDDYIKSKA